MSEASTGKQLFKFILQMVAAVALIIALARPQFGSKLETVRKEGVEVMVCLDISNSMLAEDIAPNRLGKAKRMLSRMLDQMENDKVGLIVFAGDAFTQLPITNDFVSAKMFLNSIDPKMVSIQGTAIGSAINLAVRSFTPNEESEKAIIVITDGENHEDDAAGAAKAAQEQGIKVHVVGIGSTGGAPVPDGSGRSGSFRKDREGNTVTTRLDEDMAREIAAAGQGIYARADNSNAALTAVVDALNGMKKTELESRVYADYDDKFEWFVWVAFLCLLVDALLSDRANALYRKIKLFD
jgi:Ca-activated chloride channel family protein